MSDLQCPARVVLITPQMVRANGCESVLQGRPLAGVIVAACIQVDESALVAARDLAAQRACPLEVRAELVDAASLVVVVNELADLYRGETIAVIAPSELIRDALERSSDSAVPILLAVDSSGWTVLAGSQH